MYEKQKYLEEDKRKEKLEQPELIEIMIKKQMQKQIK